MVGLRKIIKHCQAASRDSRLGLPEQTHDLSLKVRDTRIIFETSVSILRTYLVPLKRDQLVNAVREIIAVCCENHT